ncbi:hypothetical protein AM228_20175 [Planktothricoides sp. SR001]|uniref:hypothetical protein n=1 Tax=Planktothricoides sp. SR001 TaxID=1705388 RepID=UPI0006C2D69D|nr:hypothetical protein [Planktothricoides sp. SR001]KOR35118.1 hypothetical protein AM228_20175 [Planktothricoides sp. SR001]
MYFRRGEAFGQTIYGINQQLTIRMLRPHATDRMYFRRGEAFGQTIYGINQQLTIRMLRPHAIEGMGSG